jgi:hypothetical protein
MNIFFLTENTVAEAQAKDRSVLGKSQCDPSVAALPQDDNIRRGSLRMTEKKAILDNIRE